ncbi:CsbD family protein [soil metagenome]
MSNTNITSGKWRQAKGAVKERWGEITDDEYRQTEGNIDQLAGKIQEKYGHAKEDVAEQLNKLLNDDAKN